VAKVSVQKRNVDGSFELAGAIKPQTLRIIPLTGELATIAVVHHRIINANFVRIAELSH
jgi:hypothetical protein